jgi:3-hydroxybutyrate dehydrogenase
VRTQLVENQIEAQAQAHDLPAAEVVDKVLLDRTPVKRLIEPAEVAALVRWLASEPGGSLTGASVPIDGAWTAN